MSRSYRKPYAAIAGPASAHTDKKMAARGLRRRLNQWLHTLDDHEAALTPHRLECSHNNTWTWARDGCQHLVWGLYGPDPERARTYKYWIKLHRK